MAFKMVKDGVYVYCDSTLGHRIIQDYDLNKWDDLWLHVVDIKWSKVTKNGIFMKTFSA